jgi:phage gp29-like protein
LADAGDFRLVGELCEWLLGDEQIARHLHARAQALLGLDPTFEKSGDKRRSTRVIRALEAGEDWWDSYPEAELTEILIWGILLGFSVARHRWQELRGHDGRILPRPEVWEAQHVRYDWTARTWKALVVLGNNTSSAGVEEPFQPGDGTWLLHSPYGAHRPWLRGLWRGLGRFRLLRDYAASDLGRLGEDATREVIETEAGSQVTPEMRQELADDLMDLGREAKIVLPPGMTYKLVTTAQGAAEIFQKQFDLAERAFAIAIRGGNLTSNVEGGSRAAAEVQERQGELVNLRFDAQGLTTTIHDQSLVWWAEFNFGDAELAPWPVYPVDPERDIAAAANGAGKALDAAEKATALGFEVDHEAFSEEFGLSKWLKKPQRPIAPQVPPRSAPAPTDPELDSRQRSRPSALVVRNLRLASGASVSEAPGFVNGQLFADALTERATGAGVAALQGTIAAIVDVLDSIAADDPDPWGTLRARLREKYTELDAEALSDLVFRAMAMAELAGRASVQQDLE